MKTILRLISAVILITNFSPMSFSKTGDFKAEQFKSSRVKLAYKETESLLKDQLLKKGFNSLSNDLFLRVFKQEKIIEVWLKEKGNDKFIHFTDYPICTYSGTLGPKRKEYDCQVPEGFYYINLFNNTSSFFLSIQINYPNQSDRILSDKQKPGGLIFIHGDCASIGCMPIEDNIKKLYVLAIEAKNSGQNNIPVYIFPAKLTNQNFSDLKKQYSDQKELIDLWENLKTGYDFFERDNKLPIIKVDKAGKYSFQ